MISEEKPYTFKVYKEGFFYTEWVLQFEDQTIRTVSNMSATDMEQIVFLMNCAYQLGLSSGMARGING